MKTSVALVLFRLVAALFGLIERAKWYREGKAAAHAEANQEQLERIAMAEAARADADAVGDDRLHESDGFRRD